jgi:hypothetical protein
MSRDCEEGKDGMRVEMRMVERVEAAGKRLENVRKR